MKKGKKMKKENLGLIVIVAIVIILGMMLIGSYNGLVTKQERVDNSYSNLDIMLQRRADLIPNLVSTVKGYMTHESDVVGKVTEARTKLMNANGIDEKSEADRELSNSLNALMVVVENYPDLKASANFTQLTDEIAGTENRIAVARRDYNEAVKNFNTDIKRFPNNLLAGMFGFEQVEYFRASEGSTEVPNVSFE